MSFLYKGKIKEKEFAKLFTNVKFSNKETDIKEHWDVKIEIKYDVKSLKKIKRSDIEPNEFYHYIEIKNVHGELGWLYGQSDFFAFETKEFWVIVKKEDLQEFIKQKVVKQYVDNPDQSLYCLYKRNGRKDVITMVKTFDLMRLATQIIDKIEEDKIKHEIGDSIDESVRLSTRVKKIFDKTLVNDKKV